MSIRLAIPLLLTFGLSVPLQGQAQITDELGPELQVLLGATAGPDADRARRSVVGFGREALPVLLQAYATRNLTFRTDEGEVRLRLDTRGRETLLEVFAAFPTSQVRDLLLDVVTVPDVALREAGLGLLAEFGQERDLELALQLAEDTRGQLDPKLRSAFEQTLSSVLERGVQSEVLARVYGGAHPTFLASLIRRAAGISSRDAVDHLGACLGLVPDADPLALVELIRLGSVHQPPFSASTLTDTRKFLRSADTERVVLGIQTAEALDDLESVGALIDLLDHPVVAIQRRTLKALHRLTGKVFSPEGDRWRRWHVANERWWKQKAPSELATIADGAPADVSRLLMELAQERLYRHKLTDAVAASLGRDEDELVILGCSVLGHLGSWTAIRPLAACLEDDDQAVQAAALRSLRRLTGKDFGTDRAAWERLVQSPG